MEEKMKENNFKQENENENLQSPYYLTKDLIDKGCEYDLTRVYFPAPAFYNDDGINLNQDKFFTISRKRTKKVTLKYMWVSKKKEGTFANLAGFSRDKLLNEEEIYENRRSNINSILARTGNKSGVIVNKGEEQYKKFFSDLFDLVINADCLEVFKNEFYEFPPAPKQIGGEIDEYQLP